MLRLDDFFHTEAVSALVAQMAAEPAGLVVVNGLDPRPLSGLPRSFGVLSGGRATIFRVLLRELLEARPDLRGMVITADKARMRIPRSFKNRVRVLEAVPPYNPPDLIVTATTKKPGLLVIDQLTEETVVPALQAAAAGILVLTQIDTLYRGDQIAHHLAELGASPAELSHLRWVVSVQRHTTLCSTCRQPITPDADQAAALHQLFPDFEARVADLSPDGAAFYAPGRCDNCERTGRHGDVFVFDIFHAPLEQPAAQTARLSLEAYTLHLALLGYLGLDDVLALAGGQIRHAYHMLTASEHALATTSARLEQKLAQLESANRVLEERTRALITLQQLSVNLLNSSTLESLSTRICRSVRELCGADRAILYLLLEDNQAETLAVSGWSDDHLHQLLDIDPDLLDYTGPAAYNFWPPGIPERHPDTEGLRLRAGLLVPLIAEDVLAGLLIVHTGTKARFAPGDVALLETFANQAALAIQRAGLIDQLRGKITALEAAQRGLAQKERLESELELAREVQQRMLPTAFPNVPGYAFAAYNRPARQVGGDFYDVIDLGADRFAVAMADVSGKGMPAALFMALTRSLLLAEARRETSPAAVLRSVNHLLQVLGEPDMFVTLFYGVVDAAAHRLTYARAGHDYPFLLRGTTITDLGGQGMALGIFDSDLLNLSEEALTLQPGDRLILYTDGLTDIQSPDGQLYNRPRFKALLQSHAQLAPTPLCEAIFAGLTDYQADAEQFDDMTLLILGVE